MERTLARSDSVLCYPLAESDVDDAVQLYADTFLVDEPTTHRRAPDPALFLHHGT